MAKKWRESRFQSELVQRLRDRGGLVFNVHGHRMQEPGWPDIYVAVLKREAWFELKVDGGGLTKKQELVLRRLRAQDRHARVVRWVNKTMTTQVELETGEILSTHTGIPRVEQLVF